MYLASSFVCAHLQTDGSLIIRLVCLSLWVIKMSPCAISSHAGLACTFVSPHLKTLAVNMFAHLYYM